MQIKMFGYLILKRPSLRRRSSGRSRHLGKTSISAPPGFIPEHSDTLKVNDPATVTSKPALKSRKISLSCLVSSVLSFEKGRRRASRAREDELLQSAECGDLLKVKRLVQQDGVVNINCTDPLGRTPIHLAVANEQKEVVHFLLGHVDKKCVYQALMLAINLGHDEIAEMIIEHPMYGLISTEIKTHGQAHFFLNTFGDDNQFSEEITPLILAAQQNRFEIVMALLMKNEEIQKPHKYLCACTDCDRMAKCDELKFAKARLNAYKGLSSEAYISLSSEDPVLTSFELRKELRQVAADEKYYTAEYTGLADQLSDYVVRLLDKVHGNEELNAILNAYDSNTTDECEMTLPRLQLAIEYKEKKFVAHPSCQKKLTTMWYADFNTMLKSRSLAFNVAYVTSITLLYPFLAMWYIVCPRSKFGDILRTPVVKFVAQAVSFAFFLGLILTHSHVEQTKLCSTKFTDDQDIHRNWLTYKHRLNMTSSFTYLGKMCIRNHTPGFLEVLVMIWITGLLWQECKQVYQVGVRSHFMDVYNHMDFFMLKFYIASITLRQLQHLMVYSAIDYFRHEESWDKLVSFSDEAVYKVYCLNADRFYWDAWDPYHMCEALFAVANILNFTRLFYLLAISEHLGPMLITLKRMLKDMAKFMVTYIGIVLAFMVGLYNMYWYYNPDVRGKVEMQNHHIKTWAEHGFGSLEMTFRSVFWALFGLKDSRLVELQDRKVEGLGFDVRLTESVGYIIFGVYHWAAVIILLNMLIAMMTRSFEKIAIHQDTEWKFARSKLYMEYIEEGSTLPVPFNLIPSVKTIIRAVSICVQSCNIAKWCKRKRKKEKLIRMSRNNSTSAFNSKNGDIEGSIDGHCETTYVISNPDENIKKSPKLSQPASKIPSPVFSPKTMNWGFASAKSGDNDYKTVIKRVVRRYIFEHLQATVGGETSNEQQSVEAMKQEFHTIHTEINTLKPKVQTEFERVRAEMVEYRSDMKIMQKSIDNIHNQLNSILEYCKHSGLPAENNGIQPSSVHVEDFIPHPSVYQDSEVASNKFANIVAPTPSNAETFSPNYYQTLLPDYCSPKKKNSTYISHQNPPHSETTAETLCKRLSDSEINESGDLFQNSKYITNNNRMSNFYKDNVVTLEKQTDNPPHCELSSISDNKSTDNVISTRHSPADKTRHTFAGTEGPSEYNKHNSGISSTVGTVNAEEFAVLYPPPPFKHRSSSRRKKSWQNNTEHVVKENDLSDISIRPGEEIDIYEYSL